jgi:hypothetical protein
VVGTIITAMMMSLLPLLCMMLLVTHRWRRVQASSRTLRQSFTYLCNSKVGPQPIVLCDTGKPGRHGWKWIRT